MRWMLVTVGGVTYAACAFEDGGIELHDIGPTGPLWALPPVWAWVVLGTTDDGKPSGVWLHYADPVSEPVVVPTSAVGMA